jgi:hypothetical protein
VRRGRFDPQPVSLYLARREREIAQALRSGFLRSPGGLRTVTRDYGLQTVGELDCLGGIRIEVEEILERRINWFSKQPFGHVALANYRYNARLPGRGHGKGMIFRYNSPHKSHNRFHHVHRYDTLGTGDELRPPIPVPQDEVPTLRQVLKEAEEWYYAHIAGKPEAGDIHERGETAA